METDQTTARKALAQEAGDAEARGTKRQASKGTRFPIRSSTARHGTAMASSRIRVSPYRLTAHAGLEVRLAGLAAGAPTDMVVTAHRSAAFGGSAVQWG